jgi:ribose transport system substrate-binding protein
LVAEEAADPSPTRLAKMTQPLVLAPNRKKVDAGLCSLAHRPRGFIGLPCAFSYGIHRSFLMKSIHVGLILPLLLCLAGCGDSDKQAVSTVAKAPVEVSAPPPVSTKKRVGLVMKTLTNPFFIEMEKGARRAERELGIELLVKTAAQETSIEQQIQIVDDLVAAKVDAIVIAPGDSQSLVPILKKAADAGIKLVNIDNRLDPETIRQAGMASIPFISVDNDKAAYASAGFIAEGAKPGSQAAILEGIRSADNARQRMEGARRAFSDNKAVRLVATESANWKIDEGYAVTRQIFAKHPDIKLLFAANDMMALGALKYLKESGRTQVKVAAYDALDEAIAEVKAGRLAATVDQQAAEQGFQGVAFAVRLLKGETVPTVILIDTRLITSGNAR